MNAELIKPMQMMLLQEWIVISAKMGYLLLTFKFASQDEIIAFYWKMVLLTIWIH